MAGGLAGSALNSVKGVARNQLGEGLRCLLLAVPSQALTKFNRHPPKAIPRTAAGKEGFG